MRESDSPLPAGMAHPVFQADALYHSQAVEVIVLRLQPGPLHNGNIL
jgi:hypothetical protein